MLRLSDCAGLSRALPDALDRRTPILDEVSARTGLAFNIAAESNSFEMLRGLVMHTGLISFPDQIGTLPAGNKLRRDRARIDGRDVPRLILSSAGCAGVPCRSRPPFSPKRAPTRRLEEMRTGAAGGTPKPAPARKSPSPARLRQRSGTPLRSAR